MSSPCNVREGPKSPSPACRNDGDGCSGHASDSAFPTPSHPVPARLTEPELASVPSDIAKKLLQQDSYVSYLEERLNNLEGLLSNSRESEERLRTQHAESQQREKVLVRRLAAKEQEMQDVANQMTELKSSQATSSALRSALLDPAVNLLLQRLRHELATSRTRLDETQNELSAWKFTPDSNTGKRLMAKCRLLYTENEELGKLTNSGRVAKLEGELALQKSFSEEVKKSQSEMEEILQDLDEDVEGMQSTILYLQQELQKTKESAAAMESELSSLRTAVSTAVQEPQQQVPTPQRLNGKCKSECERTRAADSDSEPELVIKVSDKEMCDEDSRDAAVVTMNGDAKRTYDSDSSESNHRTSVKKVRRSSVLSYDDNMDDDALIISANGDGTISDPD